MAQNSVYTVFLMLTEALKAAGVARFIAKGGTLKKKAAKQFVKGIGPDRGFDSRGKLFQHPEFLDASNKSIAIKRFVLTPPSNDNLYLDYNHVYIDKVWTLAFWPRQFTSNPDVIRDVRKKKLVEPKLPDHKTTFKAQKEVLELWLVTLNILDFIKDFKNAELTTDVLQYHGEAVKVLENVRDAGKPIDQRRLEDFLTKDLRQKQIAVLHTASEFQFYAAAADYPRRIFFSMDIRDMGVEVLQLYEGSAGRIGDGKLRDRPLLEETLRSTDDMVERRRLTYDHVVQAFGRYYALLANSARLRRTDGSKEARAAFGADISEKLPPFEQAVQVMLGGDEVFVAAHPYFAAYVHNIIGELATTTYKDRGLNMRVCVAYSSAGLPRQGQTPREAVQESHHQAMKLADEAHGVLKVLERTQRRIERLIEKLEHNPKKKPDAPKFAERLKKLGLVRLFVRVHHARTMVLSPTAFARAIRSLAAGECHGVELVDFNGNTLDCPRLLKEAEALEKAVADRVGRDNVRTEPPPMYGKKPKKPKDDDDDEN